MRHVNYMTEAWPGDCDMRVLQNARSMGPSERDKVVLVVSTRQDSKLGPGPASRPSDKTEKHKGGRQSRVGCDLSAMKRSLADP